MVSKFTNKVWLISFCLQLSEQQPVISCKRRCVTDIDDTARDKHKVFDERSRHKFGHQ